MVQMAQMSQRQDYVALEWVKGEIAETLKQAQQALESYAEKPRDSSRLRFCLAHVHQIKGSLQMVEAHSLVQLAADMEQLLRALEEGRCAQSAEALQVLMQAVLQLPLWLEQMAAQQSPLALNVLPLRNNLRAACGEKPLAEGALLTLKSPAAPEALRADELHGRDSENLHELLHRMRLALQKALPGVVRGQDLANNLNYMARVFARLEQLCANAPLCPLWQIACALVEGLQKQSIARAPSVHILLRRLDGELKLLMERGIDGINQPPPQELLTDLLLQLNKADEDSPRIAALKKNWQVDSPPPPTPAESAADGQVMGSHPDALRAVVSALCEDLMWVKDELDLFVRGHGDNVATLTSLLLPLKQVEGTLSVLGFAQSQHIIAQQISTLQTITAQSDPADDGTLLDIAGALLFVETSLAGMARLSAEDGQHLPEVMDLPQTQQKVLLESHALLAQVKEAFIEFIGENWKREHLETVPELLGGISGALQVAGFERAAGVLFACNRYVEQRLLAPRQIPPDWESLDRLADAISAVEYYLERLRIEPAQGDGLLELAEHSLQALGCFEKPAATTAETAESRAGVEEEPFSALHELPAAIETLPLGTLEDISEAPPAPQPPTPQAGLSDEPAVESMPLSIGEVLAEPVAAINPPAAEAPLSLLPPPADEEPLDDELLEVFVEELDEVRGTLSQYLPRWQAAPTDSTLQGEVRRAFHTLKGSGRMVRALVIGELAWSVENLLNRVLDGTRAASAEVLEVTAEVAALLPDLRDEFAARAQRQRDDVDRLAARAHALAKGEPLEETYSLAEAEETLQDFSDESETPAIEDEFPAQSTEALTEVTEEAPETSEEVLETVEEETEGSADTEAATVAEAEDLPPFSTDGEREDSAESAQTLTDSALLEIFRQEAKDHLETLADFLKNCVQRLPQPVTEALHTALHTLKGSAQMAGVAPVAQIAAPLEKLVESLKNHALEIGLEEAKLLGRAGSLLRQALAQPALAAQQETPAATELLRDIAALQQRHMAALQAVQESEQVQGACDAQMLGHFLSEGMNLLLESAELLAQWQHTGSVSHEFALLLDSLHHFSEAAQILLPPFATLSGALLALYRETAEGRLAATPAFFAEAEKAQELLLSMLDKVVAVQEVAAQPEQIAALQALLHAPVTEAQEQEDSAVLDEASEIPAEQAPQSADAVIEQDTAENAAESLPQTIEEPQPLAEDLPSPLLPFPSPAPAGHPLPPAGEGGDSAFFAEDEEPAAVPAEVRTEAPPPAEDEEDAELLAIFLEEGVEISLRLGSALQRWASDTAQPTQVLLQALQRDLHTLKGGARTTGFFDMASLAHALEFLCEDLIEQRLTSSAALLELLQQGHDRIADMLESLQNRETAESAADLIQAIERFRSGEEAGEEVQGTAEKAPETPSAPVIEAEEAEEQAPEITAEEVPEAAEIESAALQQAALEKDSLPALPEPEIPATSIAAEAQADTEEPAAPSAKILPFVRHTAEPAAATPPVQEQVRIPAARLDALSNLAGEIAIFRARVEQQVGDFGFTLNEMEATIERVRGQLRHLDIETQAQTVSHLQAAAEAGGENFDPLEMDRHSELQQLARALLESATDLLDLKQALEAHSRDAQTLLMQQARASSELQESLMHSRLVRFERVVPRLSRIVRQLSRELGKKVEIIVDNAHSEMDRILLERLNAPLEHMLRNAIDHGIEPVDMRLAAGKPEVGQIRLALSREGGDIILTLEDDGCGINLEAVRRKAIERGLVSEDSELSEQELRQFILTPGFSTAWRVSQTSGRGVGMDVVQSEIRRAGGSLDIHSTEGQGTRFTIRLPFTVSVSRALMVRSGDDLFALALGTIEGVVRLSADALEKHYAQPASSLDYAGQHYELHYLGELLQNGQQPKLVGHSLPLPVILVRSGEQRFAVQVDTLAGAREIVVKGLGSQFSHVPGISGATILGDGRVVVILDLPTLIRRYRSQTLMQRTRSAVAQEQSGEERPLLVMVVDDSITVRKVTSRLLERHGMNVLTAKDGVEAIALLQEQKPDLMLLDIEMPRMDGFELATLVRHNEQLKELPIIMITSRTGAKHRERGLAIGVNDYLGKPYQEAQLLGRIEQLTQRQGTPEKPLSERYEPT